MNKRRRSGPPRTKPRLIQDIGLGVVAVLVFALAGVVAVRGIGSEPKDTVASTPRPTLAVAPTEPPVTPVQASNGREKPVALVIGDSYTDGAGASDDSNAYAQVLGDMLGWDVRTAAVPGAGYVAEGVEAEGPFLEILTEANLAEIDPDVIVLQGGFNDVPHDNGEVFKAVRAIYQQIRQTEPDTPIVTVGAFAPEGRTDSLAARSSAVKRADQLGPGVFVEALSWEYPTIADKIHPTDEGHRLIAERIAEAVRTAGLA